MHLDNYEIQNIQLQILMFREGKIAHKSFSPFGVYHIINILSLSPQSPSQTESQSLSKITAV